MRTTVVLVLGVASMCLVPSAGEAEATSGAVPAEPITEAAAEWTSTGSFSLYDPAASVAFQNALSLYTVNLDGALGERRTSSPNWSLSGTFHLGGYLLTTPTVVVPTTGSIVQWLFAVGGDDAVWAIGGSPWQSLGGLSLSTPAAVAVGSSVYVSVVGFDGAIWVRRLVAGEWLPWESLGGIGISDTAMVVHSDFVDVYVVGADEALWYRRFDGAQWSDWQRLGGILTSSPTATIHGSDVFVTATGADDAVWYQRFGAGGWSGWLPLGGFSLSITESVSHATGLDVYVVGGDEAVWYRRFDGVDFGPWESLGGIAISNPEVVAWNGMPQVFVVGVDEFVYHTSN